MKKNRFKQISVLLLTLILTVCMMPMGVFAADPDDEIKFNWRNEAEERLMNPTDPNFDKTDNLNPYGYAPGVPFLMSEENELFMLQGGDNFSEDVKEVIWDEMVNDEGETANTHTGRFLDEYKSEIAIESIPSRVHSLNFTQAVSFDPTQSGRLDHVAIVGVDSNKNTWLYVYNAKLKKWSDGLRLSDMWWVDNDSEFYQMSNFISITAGDYDGDGKDSLVVYIAGESNTGGNYDGYGLVEVKVDSNDSQITLTRVSDSTDVNVVSHDLLNPKYVENYTAIRKKDKGNSHGYVRLHGDVETGDFNEDGLDDLAVLSYSMAYDSKDFDVHAHMPYLAVSYGSSSEKIIRASQDDSYVTSSKASPYSTMCNANMTVVNADGLHGDDIVIAGHSVDYKFSSNNHYDGQSRHDNVRIAKYEYCTNEEGSGITCKFITDKGFDLNGNSVTFGENGFSNHWSGKWDVYPQMSVQGVYMNGKGNPGYVEIGGDIYDCSKNDGAIKIYTNDFASHSDDACSGNIINCNYFPYAVAGNFDGNDGGFQQIILALGRKVEGSDQNYVSYQMIGIDNSKHDAESGVPKDDIISTSFYESDKLSTYDIHHRGDNLGKNLSCLIVPVDADDDGILARYSTNDELRKTCLYTDPEIIAILQSAPYFGELNYPGGVGTTGISLTETITKANGTSHTSSVATGSTSTVRTPAVVANMSIGYNYRETSSFTNSYATSETLTYNSLGDDRVIVSRTPIYIYAYDIYDPVLKPDGDHWVTAATLIKTMHKSRIENMSLEKYNIFVDDYNEQMAEAQVKANAIIDEYNATVPEEQKAKKIDFTQLTKIDPEYCHLDNQGEPENYLGIYNENDKNKLNMKKLSENVLVMPDGYGTAGSSLSATNSYTENKSTTHGISFNSSVMVGVSALGTGVMTGGFLNASGSWGTSTSTTTASSVAISGNLYGASKKGLHPRSLIDEYQLEAQLASWDSNIKAPVSKEDEGKDPTDKKYLDTHHTYIPVYGYYITELGKPYRTPATGKFSKLIKRLIVRQKLVTNDGGVTNGLFAAPNSSESFIVQWEDESVENRKYGLLEFDKIGDEFDYKLVAKTEPGVKQLEYTPEDSKPIRQLAVVAIDDNDNPISMISEPAYALSKDYFTKLKTIQIEKMYDTPTGFFEENTGKYVARLNVESENESEIKSYAGITDIIRTEVTEDGVRIFEVHFKDGTTKNVEVKDVEDRGIQSIEMIGTEEFENYYKITLVSGEESYISLPNGKTIEEVYDGCVHDFKFLNEICPSDVAGKTADLICIKCGALYREGKILPPNSEIYALLTNNGVTTTEGEYRVLKFRTSAVNRQLGFLRMDGNVIDPVNYSYNMDNCTLSLKPDFVETMPAGTHNFLVAYNDGYLTGSINVVPKETPSKDDPVVPKNDNSPVDTGDSSNIMPYVIMMITAFGAVCVIVARRKEV